MNKSQPHSGGGRLWKKSSHWVHSWGALSCFYLPFFYFKRTTRTQLGMAVVHVELSCGREPTVRNKSRSGRKAWTWPWFSAHAQQCSESAEQYFGAVPRASRACSGCLSPPPQKMSSYMSTNMRDPDLAQSAPSKKTTNNRDSGGH